MKPKKLVRRVVPKKGVRMIENSYRKSRGLFWQTRHGFPARGMRVIAVTGTNGKTTTCSYINSVLKAAGYKTAVSTTAFVEIGGVFEPSLSTYTLEKQSEAQAFFARAKAAKADWVILEVTSHALDQKRIDGIPVEVAVMTNLTQDHLDYHKTMENYARAKARLFGPKLAPKHSILNADDEWYEFFNKRAVGEKISYGKKEAASLQLLENGSSAQGSTFTATYKGRHLTGVTQLVGLFNIYNALAAVATGLSLGIDKELIFRGIRALEAVPGRMERIDEGQDFDVLVDYAYTPDALLNTLSALQDITEGRVLIVFGATGDRDKTKRGPMGEVVASRADLIFLTDDETYTEDPDTIRNAVHEGIKQAGGDEKTTVINDRKKAIQAAFKAAKKGDVVLLAGIGHEGQRNMGGKLEPWDERQVAHQELKSI